MSAAQTAVEAAQEALGCELRAASFAAGVPLGTSVCALHHNAGIVFGGVLSGRVAAWTDRGCPVAAEVADAVVKSLKAREDIGYGVLIEDTGILMATYDGTAKKHTRKVWMTPWVEVPD